MAGCKRHGAHEALHDTRIGTEDAHGIRPDKTHAPFSRGFHNFTLEPGTFFTSLREPRSDDNAHGDARSHTVLNGLKHQGVFHDDDGKINR